MGLAKIVIDAVPHVDRRTARDLDRLAQTPLFASPDHTNMVKGFMNRERK
jgi:hypothetical protein